jgi:hypothetical protein
VLSPDKTEVERIGPSKGLFTVRCIDFVRPKEGEDPEPKDYEGKDKKYEYRAFSALLEVQSGKFKGCVIPRFLHYKFSDNGEGKAAFKGNPEKSPRLKELQEFCELTGATEEQLDWPEDGNILPDLLSVILRQKTLFDIVVKDGYVAEMMEQNDEDDSDPEDAPRSRKSDDEEDEVEEKPKAKKPKAKEVDPDEDL